MISEHRGRVVMYVPTICALPTGHSATDGILSPTISTHREWHISLDVIDERPERTCHLVVVCRRGLLRPWSWSIQPLTTATWGIARDSIRRAGRECGWHQAPPDVRRLVLQALGP